MRINLVEFSSAYMFKKITKVDIKSSLSAADNNFNTYKYSKNQLEILLSFMLLISNVIFNNKKLKSESLISFSGRIITSMKNKIKKVHQG